MLDLKFDAEQEMLRQTVRGVCATTSPLSVVRELQDDPIGYSADLWKQLAHLDLIGLQLPEEYGGSGMTALEGVVVYEEFGRSLAPSPHFVSSVLSGGAIARSGSQAMKSEWLPRLVSGEAVLTPAWLEPENGFGPKGIQLRAEPDGDGFRLSGVKRHVAFARAATRLVVLARTGDGREDIDLFLVDPNAEGVTLTQHLTIGSDAQYRVDFDRVRVTTDDRIGAAASGWATWNAVMHEGIILVAAQAVGGAQYALEITVQYA
ncbi:MAG: acyl-CoA dehydrogenase family protein, partial [Acidimicrobiales bacterium]